MLARTKPKPRKTKPQTNTATAGPTGEPRRGGDGLREAERRIQAEPRLSVAVPRAYQLDLRMGPLKTRRQPSGKQTPKMAPTHSSFADGWLV